MLNYCPNLGNTALAEIELYYNSFKVMFFNDDVTSISDISFETKTSTRLPTVKLWRTIEVLNRYIPDIYTTSMGECSTCVTTHIAFSMSHDFSMSHCFFNVIF